jgi:hypothetical protein
VQSTLGLSCNISYWIAFLIFSFPCTLRCEEPVEDIFNRGIELQNKREFDGALWELNKAMGMVKNNYNHHLRAKIEEAIRVTKGKMVVSKYASRKRGNRLLGDGDELDTIENEPFDFVVDQVFGKSLARKVWGNRDELKYEDPVGLGRTITVLPGGGIELSANFSSGFSIRSVQAASFSLVSETELSLHSGSYCLYSTNSDNAIKITSVLADLEVSSKQPFAMMVGVTTNGGMKVIGLLGRIQLTMDGETNEILPGNLIFCLPNDFSRKMDVELNTLRLTSKLLNSFKEPVIFHKKLNQQALLQGFRTQNRFRSTVGDVRGNQNFEVTVFPEE